MILNKWDVSLGIEIHTHIYNKNKIFSNLFLKKKKNPNDNISYLDIGLPGSLPLFINYSIFYRVILFGLYINSIISYISFFVRKSYFYPDISKNYQISQYNYCILKNGKILIYNNYTKIPYYKFIYIKQAHIEEDSGKIIYDLKNNLSKIDFNRSGIALLEIVSFYNLCSFYESFLYIKNVQNILSYLEISLTSMDSGDFRFDINISVKFFNSNNFGNKVELKNINSYNILKNILFVEIKRQIFYLNKNQILSQETRYYDVNTNLTNFSRNKELSFDYKYFLDPDFFFILITTNQINYLITKLLKLKIFLKRNYNICVFLNLNFNYIVFNKRLIDLFNNFILLFNYNNLILFNTYFYSIFLIYDLFIFKFKKNFSIKQLNFIFSCFLYDYISFNYLKKILNFILKYNITNNTILYKIIIFNNLKVNFNKNLFILNFNEFILINIKLLHEYFFNKKIINLLINNFFIIYSFNISFSGFYNYINYKIIF